MACYSLYSRVNELVEQFMRSRADDSILDEMWRLVHQHPRFFEAASVDGQSTGKRIQELAQAEITRRQPLLEGQFLFLPQRRFWFYPTPADPLAGWKDFWAFAYGYNFMPTEFKEKMGPYSLTIQPLTTPAAKN